MHWKILLDRANYFVLLESKYPLQKSSIMSNSKMKMSLSMKLGVSSLSIFLASMLLGVSLKIADPKNLMRDCSKKGPGASEVVTNIDNKCHDKKSKIQLSQDALFVISLLLLGASVAVHNGSMSASKSLLIGLLLLFIIASQYKLTLPFSSAPLIQSGAHWRID